MKRPRSLTPIFLGPMGFPLLIKPICSPGYITDSRWTYLPSAKRQGKVSFKVNGQKESVNDDNIPDSVITNSQ